MGLDLESANDTISEHEERAQQKECGHCDWDSRLIQVSWENMTKGLDSVNTHFEAMGIGTSGQDQMMEMIEHKAKSALWRHNGNLRLSSRGRNGLRKKITLKALGISKDTCS